jgi:hypothetical protein
VVALSATSVGGGAQIVVGGTASAPVITTTLTAVVTAALVFTEQVLGSSQSGFTRGDKGVYDMEVTLASGEVFRIYKGVVTLDDEVTYT